MEHVTHDEAFELLPWFVNETLTDPEHAAVERHVRSCLPCRIALHEQQQLRTLIERQPTVPLSVEPPFDQLMQRIGPRRDRRSRGESRPSVAAVLAAAWRRHAVTAGVLVASLGLASWLATRTDLAPQDAFVTLTGEAGAGFELDVVFAAETSEAERRALVRAIDGVITSGPSELGRYRIRIDAAGADAIDATVQRLREDRRVRFAARSLGAESAP